MPYRTDPAEGGDFEDYKIMHGSDDMTDLLKQEVVDDIIEQAAEEFR